MTWKKPLSKKGYMAQFSRSARWRLGAAEAEEAIADYREMVFREERDPEKLVEELGDPVQAAYLLTDVKQYRQWLTVLAVLTFCVVLPALWVVLNWNIFYDLPPLSFLGEREQPIPLLAVGLAAALVWFQRRGGKSGSVPKGLLIALGVLLVVGLAVLADMWYVSGLKLDIHEFAWEDGRLTDRVTIVRQAHILGSVMMLTGVLALLTGLAGLVLARCRDRRWRALYLLSLTILTLLAVAMAHFGAMDFSIFERNGVYEVQTVLFQRLIPISLVGLLGTGVALC